ncbi:MAG: CsbD family protein, partial [Pseudomonadales bacterium]
GGRAGIVAEKAAEDQDSAVFEADQQRARHHCVPYRTDGDRRRPQAAAVDCCCGQSPVARSAVYRKGMQMNKDQVKGRVKRVKGKVKAAAGVLVGNKRLEVEGKIDESLGDVQAGYGDVKKKLNLDD